MGFKTAADIIEEGQLKAGRDDLDTQALKWLNTWLRKQYALWSWPFLHKTTEAAPVTLAEGATSVRVGGGNGGITESIRRILDPVDFRGSDYGSRGRARIRQLVDSRQNPERSLFFNAPTSGRGLPEFFTVRSAASTAQTAANQNGIWDMFPDVTPDRTLLLRIEYLILPAEVTANQYPLYPSDDTMVQYIYAQALLNNAGNDAEQVAVAKGELETAVAMAINDRLAYGSADGTNDKLGLDPGVYR